MTLTFSSCALKGKRLKLPTSKSVEIYFMADPEVKTLRVKYFGLWSGKKHIFLMGTGINPITQESDGQYRKDEISTLSLAPLVG